MQDEGYIGSLRLGHSRLRLRGDKLAGSSALGLSLLTRFLAGDKRVCLLISGFVEETANPGISPLRLIRVVRHVEECSVDRVKY